MSRPSQNWREGAVKYLSKQTGAMLSTIEWFVDNFWQMDADNEENLYSFRRYAEELQGAYNY